METQSHQPPVTEVIQNALGSEMQGVANALILLAETTSTTTCDDLIAAIRTKVNGVGNLQFDTSQPNRHNRLNIKKDDTFDSLTVIVEKNLVNEAISKIRGNLDKFLAV